MFVVATGFIGLNVNANPLNAMWNVKWNWNVKCELKCVSIKNQ